MLEIKNSILLVIDIQGNLAHAMHDKESLFKATGQLIKGIKCLEIPMILTEQNPKGLGPTIPEIRELIPDLIAIPKISFSCCNEKTFMEEVKKINKRQILISGIESHICIYQTTINLLDMGYEVHIVTDAVASRDPKNRELALRKMERMGATMTCVEMALFELMRTAEHPRFRDIVKIIK